MYAVGFYCQWNSFEGGAAVLLAENKEGWTSAVEIGGGDARTEDPE
jgi:hypothetical protein